jgi:hypothetical protein
VHPKQPRDLGSGSIVLQHFFRFPDLRAGKLGRPSKVPASSLGRLDTAALAAAALSQMSLQNASFSRQSFATAKPQGFPWWLRLLQNLQVLRRSQRRRKDRMMAVSDASAGLVGSTGDFDAPTR